MSQRSTPVLHRDDPDKDPLIGHVKVTQKDWLNVARDVLVTDGVGEVKILGLARRMGVSRSSFYWYFRDRADLLATLLEGWEDRNTFHICTQCARPSTSITQAVCHFFICFIDPAQFDHGLDFAVREWARRDMDVRARVDSADARRIAAVTQAFERHGFAPHEADARARILYFMQLGYHALEVREDMETRLSRVKEYLRGFTGQDVDEAALEAFFRSVRGFEQPT